MRGRFPSPVLAGGEGTCPTGAYSWWSYRFNARANNAGWRIDYFIVSQRLADRIAAADIYSEIPGSDHCPVALVLR